ncbi:hypothetical protein SAMN05660742_12648 [Propionispira arboris]|uniref:DUF4062 domain-containing protein n=1 Tax=Propionispira arboris TaxID=84035 RepID=A0A1H7CWP7_9FIRM|nr:hypothetical protein [Propionispira arboris]SEJ93926.1 hypothetical protein SAMN05660742_12648 [Propionispira arboris]
MPKTMTQFELLISCPSDVQQELHLIKETVETFNKIFGSVNNARIEVLHWSSGAYPESGDHPQKILNKQIVFSCDAAVAVFWTKFGTPTDAYSSGTEEEIEELIKSGKQVFLYFSDCPLKPSEIDNEQYKKVLAFREKYKDKGLYWTYSNLDDFKKDFLNHLSLHFLKMFGEGTDFRAKSKLCINGVCDRIPKDPPTAFHTNFLNSPYMINMKQSIIDNIEEIKNIRLFIKINKEKKNDAIMMPEIWQQQIKAINNIFPSEPAKVDDCKDAINIFIEQNHIDIQNDFYCLGNLMIIQSPMGGGLYGMEPSKSETGSDEEKKKYELIRNVKQKIDKFMQLTRYFVELDANVYLNLALCNIGTDFDEDIDVKLFINKNHLCVRKQLPIPEDDILNVANEIFELVYKPKKTVAIDEYYDYDIRPKGFSIPHLNGFGPSYNEIIESKRNDFNNNCKTIFCYEYFEDDECDIVCYNQKYLKQNTNSFFPSYLVFKDFPEQIRYKITSKRSPNIIEGELICK